MITEPALAQVNAAAQTGNADQLAAAARALMDAIEKNRQLTRVKAILARKERKSGCDHTLH